ncbi:MAG: hypothetical protein EOO13_09325 [Chitinophagaceae bacterium]|nr:MAG: hypothetical protein EOO13_09325 [Chitinophagaceae bacterium]
MNINLNNYEEYLLMYVDNELSAAERMHVEEFLRDYPYLKEELEVLQQTVLPLENLLFDKSSLIKPIIDEATQEKLLMHLDGELPAGESLSFQNKLSADKVLQQEWAQLQKTKLDAADSIEHPDKESLYKKEKAKIISSKFFRLAVAAMLIGAGFYVGINLVKETNSKGVEVAIAQPGKKEQPATNVDNNNTASVDPSAIQEQEISSTPGPGESTQSPVGRKDVQLKDNIAVVKENEKKPVNKGLNIKDAKVDPAQANNMVANNQPQEKRISAPQPKELPQRNTENVLRTNNDIASLQRSNNSIDLPGNITTTSKPVIDKEISNNNNAFARTAALSFDDNNQDQILMMEEENVSRSKAAVFIKKLKRNVERRTNIKPGKSLRIAGFEFAVK